MKPSEYLINTIAELTIPRHSVNSTPLGSLYKQYLPEILRIYPQVEYWHGTGGVHYEPLGKSKYEGVNFNKTYDVLQAIINSGGIIPKFDPVVNVNGEYINSISLTPFRMYARAYAEFNQYYKNDFAYVFGSINFWFKYLASLQMIEGDMKHNIRSVLKSTKDTDFVQKTQPWTDTLRKRDPKEVWTALNFYKVRSDIPENYGILFGIKKNTVEKISFNKTIERFETRAINKISLSDITHLEVTKSKVSEVQNKISLNNLQIPVIPIEVGELYCSQIPLKKLSGIE